LILLIPLLHLVGFPVEGQPNGMPQLLNSFFSSAGISLTLFTVLSTYVVIVAAHALAGRYQGVACGKLCFGYTQFLQNQLYDAFVKAHWPHLSQTRGSDITRVLTNDVFRVGYCAEKLIDLIAILVLTLIYVGVVLWVAGMVGLLALVCIIAILLLLQTYNRQAHHLAETYQTAIGSMYSVVAEHVSGMKVAKSYGLEFEHIKCFSEITEQIATLGIRFFQVDSTTQMFHQIGAAVALSSFFYIGAEYVTLSSSNLLLLVVVFARLSPKVSRIQHYTQYICNGLPAYDATALMLKKFEISSESYCQHVLTSKLIGSISLRGVSFRYKDRRKPALSNINFVIPERSTTAIMGPSGAGKTTLADLLMGLLTPTDGKIFIGETPLDGDSVHVWRGLIGYVPQETFLFHNSIRSNLLLVRPESTDEELWAALKNAAADSFVKALPLGLDTVVGDRGIRLSGGERQRIALARALLRKPMMLILDEATSSLDHENERRIQEAIDGLHGDLTMVIIAHRLSTIRKADRIMILEQGQLLEIGSWESLSHNEDSRFRTILQEETVQPKFVVRDNVR
jgi:ATP-binding cassette, subfamily C, bacterial